MATVYGDTWKNLSARDKAAATQAFKDEYTLTGDYKAAV